MVQTRAQKRSAMEAFRIHEDIPNPRKGKLPQGQAIRQSKTDVGADKHGKERQLDPVYGRLHDGSYTTVIQAAELRAIVAFNKDFGCGVSQGQIDIYLGLTERTSRRLRHQELVSELVLKGEIERDPRADNPKVFTDSDTRKMYNRAKEGSFDEVNKDWKGLAVESKIGKRGKAAAILTIRRAAHTVGIRDILAVYKPELDPENATSREAHAEYWCQFPLDHIIWQQVRVSDESHRGVPKTKRAHIKAPLGTRENFEKVQRIPPRSKKGKVKKGKEEQADEAANGPVNGSEKHRQAFWPEMIHYWAAAGYKFKSRLVFYDTGIGDGGNIDQLTYEEDIIRNEVATWWRGEPGTRFDWILMEDLAPGHGKHFQKGSMEFIGIQDGTQFEGKPQFKHLDTVKRQYKIKYAFFPTGGCDLNIAETLWQILDEKAPDHHKMPPWRRKSILRYIWDHEIDQRWIDEYFVGGGRRKTLAERWREVYKAGGQRIAA